MPVQATTKLTKIIEQHALFSQYKQDRDKLAEHFKDNHHFELIEKEVNKTGEDRKPVLDRAGNPVKHKIMVKTRVFPVAEDKKEFERLREAKAKILRFDRQSVMLINKLTEEVIEYIFVNSASAPSTKGKMHPTYSWKNLNFSVIPSSFQLALLNNSPTFTLIRDIRNTAELQNKQKIIHKLKTKKPHNLQAYVAKDKDPILLKNCVISDAENFKRRVLAKRNELVAASKDGQQYAIEIGQMNKQLAEMRKGVAGAELTPEEQAAKLALASAKAEVVAKMDLLQEDLMVPAYEEVKEMYVDQLQTKHAADLKYILGIYESINKLSKGYGQSAEYISFTKHIIKNSTKINGKIQDKLKHLVARIVEEVMQQLAPKLKLYLKDARNHRITLDDVHKVIGIWLSSPDAKVDEEFAQFIEDFKGWYTENLNQPKKDLPTTEQVEK